MTASDADRIEAAVAELARSIDQLNRTIQGDITEGNPGMLPRLLLLERRVERLWWSFPFLVTGGTALGQVVSAAIGIGS